MYAYISYLDEPCNACLLLLTVDNGAFSVLSECKKKVVEVRDLTARCSALI